MLHPDDVKRWISAGFSDADIVVDGDGHHFYASIVSDQFKNLNLISRHRMVYDVLGDKMKAEIHALSLKTYTNEEYEQLEGE